TVAKRLSFARTILDVPRKHKPIDENPFSGVAIPAANVSARQRFIDLEVVTRLLAVANPTWRTIIALARYGGLRCPSEVLSLEWRTSIGNGIASKSQAQRPSDTMATAPGRFGCSRDCDHSWKTPSSAPIRVRPTWSPMDTWPRPRCQTAG